MTFFTSNNKIWVKTETFNSLCINSGYFLVFNFGRNMGLLQYCCSPLLSFSVLFIDVFNMSSFLQNCKNKNHLLATTSYRPWLLWNSCMLVTGHSTDTRSGDTRKEILCSPSQCWSACLTLSQSVRGRWPPRLCFAWAGSADWCLREIRCPRHSFEKGCLHSKHCSGWTQIFSFNCFLEGKWIWSTLKGLMTALSPFVGQLIRYQKKGPSQSTLKNLRGAHSWSVLDPKSKAPRQLYDNGVKPVWNTSEGFTGIRCSTMYQGWSMRNKRHTSLLMLQTG